ncbi:helix-turn-helix domain-containing protein [Shewanella oncorhynchi]|uniref:helix-turn-helix domain-containing protein n=1 Tax=Shewanella oncorhynchi TaxID=2726434 RepID=UPI003D7BB586
MQTINSYLATTLKALRNQKGWSLDKAAQETGVSKAMIGQIERGESSPTIATLWKIASGFNISLSTFLEPTPQSQGAVFRKPDELRQQPATDGMLVASLFPFEERFGFEMFELTLLPHYERLSEPHETGVTEHVIVLSGTMEVLVDGQWQTLKQGEAVRFAADKPHGYRNLNEQAVVFHDIIHYQRGNEFSL